MTAVTYPGPVAPAPVAVRFDAPEGWIVQAAPGVALVATSPDVPDGARPGVVLSIRRVDATLTLDQIVGMIGDEFAALPAVTLGEATVGTAAGAATEHVVRSIVFDADDVGRFVQIQAMWLAPRTEHTADVVTLSLTHDLDADAAALEQYQRIIESVEIG